MVVFQSSLSFDATHFCLKGRETCFTLIVFQVLQKNVFFLIDENFLLGLEGNSWSVVKRTPSVERGFLDKSLNVPQVRDDEMNLRNAVAGDRCV